MLKRFAKRRKKELTGGNPEKDNFYYLFITYYMLSVPGECLGNIDSTTGDANLIGGHLQARSEPVEIDNELILQALTSRGGLCQGLLA